MSNPMIRIHDLATNQVIDREMTETEFSQWEIEQAATAAIQAQFEANAQAKELAQSKLAALGLTADDLKALGL